MNLLNTAVIYNKDNSYQDYVGQTVKFNIVKRDGSKVSVAPFYQFMIIDGIGYGAKEKSTENLENFANKILDTQRMNIINND